MYCASPARGGTTSLRPFATQSGNPVITTCDWSIVGDLTCNTQPGAIIQWSLAQQKTMSS